MELYQCGTSFFVAFFGVQGCYGILNFSIDKFLCDCCGRAVMQSIFIASDMESYQCGISIFVIFFKI